MKGDDSIRHALKMKKPSVEPVYGGKVARTRWNPTEEANKEKVFRGAARIPSHTHIFPFCWLLSYGPLGLCHEPVAQ